MVAVPGRDLCMVLRQDEGNWHLSHALQQPALRYGTNFVVATLKIFPAVANFSRIFIARTYGIFVETYILKANGL